MVVGSVMLNSGRYSCLLQRMMTHTYAMHVLKQARNQANTQSIKSAINQAHNQSSERSSKRRIKQARNQGSAQSSNPSIKQVRIIHS
jgi:hypothetical protein